MAAHSDLAAHLLFHRGIRDAESAERFLTPDYERDTHDPFLMNGMEAAVTRVLVALEKNEQIVVYSDYDADGVPGGVLLHDFFKKVGFDNFTNYIPHRHEEGFGLNRGAIDEFARNGASLLITVDCGITDADEVAHATSLGIDTIITDHHLPNGDLPPALAILDPKQEGCAYPFKELCGAGVAYKLAQALLARLRFGSSYASRLTIPVVGWEKWLLDLVGLATLSDMVPLVGENRVLARYGLVVLRKSPRVGLQKLLRKVGVSQRLLTEDDIVFSVTPKLNAASRTGSADVAFRLLSTTDETDADAAVEELIHRNDERKGVVGSLVRQIRKVLAERAPAPVIVAGNPLWRPSLLGLAANALVKERACPVFLWGRDGEDALKGSCRSDGSVNVVSLMREAGDVFTEYGGHAFSGGFTVVPERVHVLEDSLARAYERVKSDASDEDESAADLRITPDEVSSANQREVELLAPFGQGNPKPIFVLENVEVRASRLFGKEGNHVEIILPRADGSTVKAIRFFADAKPPRPGSTVSFLASLEQSNFGGRSQLRLRIVEFI